MKSVKFNQFVLSLLVVLSLFVSSVAACACSHHLEKSAAEPPSCHEHSATAATEKKSETAQTTVSTTDCVCFQTAPKIIVKTENLKVDKHIAAISAVKPNEIAFIGQTISARIDFSKPLFLSDSFYNLSPGRAPPVL